MNINVKGCYMSRENLKEKRLQETQLNNQGLLMKIIEYQHSNDMDVQFEDGTIVYHVSYRNFKDGRIRKRAEQELPNVKYLNQKAIADNGMNVKIIHYQTHQNITVQFEDGTIIKSSMMQFKKGRIHYPTEPIELQMKNGLKAKMVRRIDKDHGDFLFEDGYLAKNKVKANFRKGFISHPKRPISIHSFPFQIGDILISGVAYYSNNPNLYCTCQQCGLQDILTYDEINQHQCKGNSNYVY